jgi:uncharacterized repeat protein (TIGR01451 family)
MTTGYRIFASVLVLFFFAPISVAWSQGEADLGITKTVDNPAPTVGATILYTIALTNHGPDTATNILVSDPLPTGVTYVSSTTTQGVYIVGSGIWVLSSVDAGSIEALNITVTVDEGTASQTITNTAMVSSCDQLDPNPANNTDSVDIVVTGSTSTERLPWGRIKALYR